MPTQATDTLENIHTCVPSVDAAFCPALTGFIWLAAGDMQAPAATPAPKTQAIRICTIFSVTGGLTDMGDSARVGAEVAVNEIKQADGYLGRPLELLVRDDKTDPKTELKMVEQLVLKEKVVATIGFSSTGLALKAIILLCHK